MQWTCKPSDLKGQRIGIKLANETTTSCQLVQNFIVCAVATFKTLLFVQSRHSKLYCLCSLDIQNFIVCAVATFKTLLFVQSRHSKLYCLCSRDIQNFIVCAVATFKTLLFVQSSHSKLFSLRVPFWGSVDCCATQSVQYKLQTWLIKWQITFSNDFYFVWVHWLWYYSFKFAVWWPWLYVKLMICFGGQRWFCNFLFCLGFYVSAWKKIFGGSKLCAV